MVTTGSPDWQQVTQQHSSVLVLADGQDYSAGITTLFSGPSAAWASLQVRCTVNSGYGKIVINWYADSAMTQGVGTDVWMVNTDTGLSISYPVQAAFCRVDFNNTNAVVTNATIYLVGTQIQVPGIVYKVTSQVAGPYSVTIPASGHVRYYPSFLCRGPAWLWFDPYDSSAKISMSLSVSDETSALISELYFNPGSAAEFGQLLYVPDQPLILELDNQDSAASHECNISLVVPLA